MTQRSTDGDDVTFDADGRRIRAKKGQSVAAALWQHGDRALSRSIKYHRPRGWSCGIGRCNDCMMRVDGVPNVKTCQTPAQNGMKVEGQNSWPSVRRDLLRVNDLVFRHGIDHHRGYLRPRPLYPLMTAVMRRFAAWGHLPEREAADPIGDSTPEALRPEVLIVGAGPAGLAAADGAYRSGCTVLVVEESDRIGGHAARLDPDHQTPDPDDAAGVPVLVAELQRRWQAEVRAAGIDVRTQATVVAAYRNGLVLVRTPDRLLAVRPQATVVATGGIAHNAGFAHNDKPGVMSAAGCQALLHREGVHPGTRAVVYGGGAHGLHVADDLVRAGIDVAAIVEPGDRLRGPAALVQRVEGHRIPIDLQARIEAVHGFAKTKAVSVRTPGGRIHVPCDLVVVALGLKTTPELFQGLGARLRYAASAGGAVPVVDEDLATTAHGVFAAGDTAGIGSLKTARASGRLAGLGAARHIGHRIDEIEARQVRERLAALRARHGGPFPATEPPAVEVPA